jgi:hypothetical protein
MVRQEKIESMSSRSNNDINTISITIMSNRSFLPAIGLARAVNRGSKVFRITPPPPPMIVQQRSFLTRRSTSFYTHSYPQQGSSSGVEIPYIPPAPERLAEGEAGGVGEDGKRKERKAKYLESLMDKAGELSLRCELASLVPSGFVMLIYRFHSGCGWGMESRRGTIQED